MFPQSVMSHLLLLMCSVVQSASLAPSLSLISSSRVSVYVSSCFLFYFESLLFPCSMCLVLLSLWHHVHVCQLCFPRYSRFPQCRIVRLSHVMLLQVSELFSCFGSGLYFSSVFACIFLIHVHVPFHSFYVSFSLTQFRF